MRRALAVVVALGLMVSVAGCTARRAHQGRRLAVPATACRALDQRMWTDAPVPSPGGSLASPSGAAGESRWPGAAGSGDPYFAYSGNGGYDVIDYDLTVKYQPGTDTLTGRETLTATATATLSSFNLDLHGLLVRSITVNVNPATWRRAGDELVITPAVPIATAARFTVVLTYEGVPEPYQENEHLGETGFLATEDGAVVVGEPEVAASWFAVNDHPSDKATYTITIVAPQELKAISNGVLADTCTAGMWTATTWRVSQPMASYLATVVIGDYRVTTSTHRGLPMVLAVASDLPDWIDRSLAATGDIVDYLASMFGPYPFDAIGGIVIDDERVHFALENQTRPIYSDAFFDAPGTSSWVLAHELAHQWFGDSVTVADWSQIWLNEGFATYAQWLWEEHQGGRSVQQSFDSAYGRATGQLWATPPGDPGAADLLSNSVYQRGAMTLHTLRGKVGDTAFFAILRGWATEKAGGIATTAEFIELAESISGKQLDQLFSAWLYGTTAPAHP